MYRLDSRYRETDKPLETAWRKLDLFNNERRLSRMLMTRGHDTKDRPISDTFDPDTLTSFTVYCED